MMNGIPRSQLESTAIRSIAIDWSGALTGQRRKIWLAEARNGHLVNLKAGRTRDEVIQGVIEDARHNPRIILGLDFAFSLPAWFLMTQGVASIAQAWALVAQENEEWLKRSPSPFWGRPGYRKPAIPEEFRETERHIAQTTDFRPKSVFQIGGAGAVGTGSLRGMPFLQQLRAEGFSVWPLDPPNLPLVIEIYPRLLTGDVIKSRPQNREQHLAAQQGMTAEFKATAARSDDAFDAALSALAMDLHQAEVLELEPGTGAMLIEGAIWQPRPSSIEGMH